MILNLSLKPFASGLEGSCRQRIVIKTDVFKNGCIGKIMLYPKVFLRKQRSSGRGGQGKASTVRPKGKDFSKKWVGGGELVIGGARKGHG